MLRLRRVVASLACVMLCLPARGQGVVTLAGYAERVEGEVLKYHGPDPAVTHGLLARSLDADRVIEWETAPVPEGLAAEFAEFVWLFGLDVNPEQRRFELRVDGEAWFEFRNPPTSDERE